MRTPAWLPAVTAQINQVVGHGSVCLAFSGGLDSHVLLHIIVHHCAALPIKVVHVHHGLQNEADDWAQHCADVCKQYGCQFVLHKVNINCQGNTEAEARQLRYQALRKESQDDCVLLTAHHADDQAETVLLQLLRGSGPQGLAAMPYCQSNLGTLHLRPLLCVSRQELLAYAKLHHLSWQDDPSNQDTHYRRNFLRHKVMPALKEVWPSYQTTLSRSATLMAESADILLDMARIDGEKSIDDKRQLSVHALGKLSIARQFNLLRYWLKETGCPTPQRKHLSEIIKNMLGASPDSQPQVCWDNVEVRRFQDKLSWQYQTGFDNTWSVVWNMQKPLCLPADLGVLEVSDESDSNFFLPQPSPGCVVRVGFRQGGESIVLPKRGRQSLKKLMQAWGVPPWLRDRIPLIFYDDILQCVVGYASSQVQSQSEKKQIGVSWQVKEVLLS